MPNAAYISCQQGVAAESAPFTLIVGMQNNEHVFDSDHEGERPDDKRKDLKHIVVVWCAGEGGREDVQGAIGRRQISMSAM